MTRIRSKSAQRAKAGEVCSDCGKEFSVGERIMGYWVFGELHSVNCRNSVACEKRMPEREFAEPDQNRPHLKSTLRKMEAGLI